MEVCQLVVLIGVRSSCILFDLLGVDSLPLVGHLSNKPSKFCSCVGCGLDPAIRQGNHEGTLDIALKQNLFGISQGMYFYNSHFDPEIQPSGSWS